MRQLPNLITFSRLLLAVVAFWFLERLVRVTEPGDTHRVAASAAFWFYLAASLTDTLDGWVARRFGWVTAVGRVADPVVDKVLTLGALVYLSSIDFLELPLAGSGLPEADLLKAVMPLWAVVLLLAREFLVTALRGLIESRGMQFPADRFGKTKMTLQTIYICILIGAAGGVPDQLHLRFLYLAREPALLFVLFWLVIAMTVFSGANYCLRAARMLSRSE